MVQKQSHHAETPLSMLPIHRRPNLQPQDQEVLRGLLHSYGVDKIVPYISLLGIIEVDDFNALNHLLGHYPAALLSRLAQTLTEASTNHYPALSVNSSVRASIQSFQSQDSGYMSPASPTPDMKPYEPYPDQPAEAVLLSPHVAGPRSPSQHLPVGAPLSGTDSTVAGPRYQPPSQKAEWIEQTSASASKKHNFICPMCHVESNYAGAIRKDDFKAHLKDFHCTNSLWICRHPQCGQSFEFAKAYQKHAKAEHGLDTVSRKDLDAARVLLTPQRVYACGFATCGLKVPVFEVDGDHDGLSAAKEFMQHVAEHFVRKDVPVDLDDWKFHVQVGNLMCQRALHTAWTEDTSDGIRANLAWKLASSREFKKVLEHRSWDQDKVSTVLAYARRLGGSEFASEGARPVPLPKSLGLPLRRSLHPFPMPATTRPVRVTTSAATMASATRARMTRPNQKQDGPTQPPHPTRNSSLAPQGTVDAQPNYGDGRTFQAATISRALPERPLNNPTMPPPPPQPFPLPMGSPGSVPHTAFSPTNFPLPPTSYQRGGGAGGVLHHKQSASNLPLAAPTVAGQAPPPPLRTLRSNSQLNQNFSRPRKSYENLKHGSRPASFAMPDAPPLPCPDGQESLPPWGGELENAFVYNQAGCFPNGLSSTVF